MVSPGTGAFFPAITMSMFVHTNTTIFLMHSSGSFLSGRQTIANHSIQKGHGLRMSAQDIQAKGIERHSVSSQIAEIPLSPLANGNQLFRWNRSKWQRTSTLDQPEEKRRQKNTRQHPAKCDPIQEWTDPSASPLPFSQRFKRTGKTGMKIIHRHQNNGQRP